ncbi:peptidoglycan DD-metalloendopeptidase family protein [Candidatus Saccharibacteria bacterium]|nr:peptidoglycan DD-metalloendopeptidase family protein [Candidatus Saccharibacteria bacterium]
MKVNFSLKKFLNSFSCFFLSLLAIISGGIILPVPTYAKVDIPKGRDDEFGENNIVFYNPEDKNEKKKRKCSSGKCNIKGETKDEKLWSGLRNKGFTPEQTAGLMGNFAHEGGSPTRQEDAYIKARDKGCRTMEGNPYTIWTYDNEHHSSCMQSVYSHYSAGKKVVGIGLGFVQWTSKGRREGYLGKVDGLGLLDYFEGDAYKTYGALSDDQLLAKITSETGSEDDYWSLWCAAIEWIYEELHSGTWSAFFNETTVTGIAEYVAIKYEVCNGCTKGSSTVQARVATANEIYERYKAGEFDAVDPGEGGGGEETSEEGKEGEEGEKKEDNDKDCGSDNEKVRIGDYDYVFPLSGATKSNYLNPGGSAGESVLSRIPCGPSGHCHHGYDAVDLGLRAGMAGYKEYKASDFPGSPYPDMKYYSTGVKVLAIANGTIEYVSQYKNGTPADHYDKCGQLKLRAEDGNGYWYGHMDLKAMTVKGGDTVKAGDVLGAVGVPQCAKGTQAHLHISIEPEKSHYIIDVIDELWKTLPD